MADQIPLERLQPCLLDRLTDDEPTRTEESRAQRVISHQKYRRGVLRDLQWLLGSEGFPHIPGIPFQLQDYPAALRSVINFGTRQLCGLTAPDMARLQEELSEAIRVFEPRITPQNMTIHASLERNSVTFEVEGELWAHPMPEHLHVTTTVDLESGQSLLGDAPHG
jgi:type VI secretion system protein ImpF